MYKHRATMADRRHQILILMAKGYKNKQIARKMGLSLSNTRMQKWRLYCFLGEIHTAIDAIYMGLQMGLIYVFKFHLYLYSVVIHCFLSPFINRILSFLNFE